MSKDVAPMELGSRKHWLNYKHFAPTELNSLSRFSNGFLAGLFASGGCAADAFASGGARNSFRKV
jgi:hypothetical protein